MIRAVLFEVEGVLVETAGARRHALADALRVRGHHRGDAAGIDPTLPLRAAARAALESGDAVADETEVDLVAGEAARRFAAWLGKGATLAPGARSFVERLHGRVRLGIVSRATRAEVHGMLTLAGLGDVFECVVAEEDAWPPLPDPAPCRAALVRLGRRGAIAPGEVVSLADGAAGIAAARGAGVRCIAVGAVPAHVALQADALARSLDDDVLAMLDGMAKDREERR